MKNVNDLREKLFETLDGLQKGTIDIEKARAVADVAQVIVNTAKVEVDYLRAKDKMDGLYIGTGFIEPPQQDKLKIAKG